LKSFAQLVNILGTSTKTNERLEALSNYFSTADDKDKVWVIALFTGRRPKRAVNSTQLWEWCGELTNLPTWLFAECYHSVGDLAETISLVLPENISVDGWSLPVDRSELTTTNIEHRTSNNEHSLSHYLETLISIAKEDESIRKQFILRSWSEMNQLERFVFTKLITGNFRIGVSQGLMVNALAKTTGMESSIIAHSISGNWDPSTTTFDELLTEHASTTDHSKPYPFYLAYALQDDPASLGSPEEWQAEWKWDGIRGQIIKRNNDLFVWSRGEELMTGKFPEYDALKELLPDGIAIDGEIICIDATSFSPLADSGNSPSGAAGLPLPFAALQTRIGRKNITRKQLNEAPVAFFAYDLLEYNYEDFRNKPLSERRSKLEEIVNSISPNRTTSNDQPTTNVIKLSAVIDFSSWDQLTQIRTHSREMGSEGLMLKRKSSIYQTGRKVGDWWKWKIDPLVIDAVMVYAAKGSGRRSNLYTDYTFAVRDGDKLVTFTKAYSGLTDKEFAQVDAFVKRNSLEKFGPVRTVKPELVFEIAFEGIAASNRHKSGVALRFPRINRWRKDKKPDEINTLDDLKEMLKVYGK
jgi:DNA ligase-1